MKKKLIPALIGALCIFNANSLMANQETDRTERFEDDISIGVGATSGAVIAGPIGFLFGGIAGILVSLSDGETGSDADDFDEFDYWTMDSTVNASNIAVEPTANAHAEKANNTAMLSNIDERNSAEPVFVAVARNDGFMMEHGKVEESNKLKAIITEGMNVVVHYTSGSVAAKPFYETQFISMLNVLKEMPELELTLEGYSDRRGTKEENIQLASQRMAAIRDYFIQHGLDEKRITLHAYGEEKPLSTSGELASYMFDRRVVLSFNKPPADSQKNIAEVNAITLEEHSQSTAF